MMMFGAALIAAIESEMGKPAPAIAPAPAVAPASAAAPSVFAKQVAAVAAAAGKKVLELLCAILIFLVGFPIVIFMLCIVDSFVNDGAVTQFILLCYGLESTSA